MEVPARPPLRCSASFAPFVVQMPVRCKTFRHTPEELI